MSQNSLGVGAKNRHDSFGRIVTARAAILAAGFCLVASMATAAPITCGLGTEGDEDPLFPGSAYRCESQTQFYDSSNTSQTYVFDFGNFTNTLTFDTVERDDLAVTMSAFFVVPGNPAFLDRIPAPFVPENFFTSDGFRWIYFRVEDLQPIGTQAGSDSPPTSPDDYTGEWRQDIVWLGDGSYVDPQVLHDSRPLDTFDAVITVPGSFDPCPPDFEGEGCFVGEFAVKTGGPIDPTIAGAALDFSDTTVVDTVPEPSSLLLLGVGLSGFVYRRRRQRSAAARVESA
jgi:hypothetical protein